MNKEAVVVIDPQFDFVDSHGTLPVKGASRDMMKIANFIRKRKDKIGFVTVTGDAHPSTHIGSVLFWKDEFGNPPPPFTAITYTDMFVKWWPIRDDSYARFYVQDLENKGEVCMAWPVHCLAGQSGALFNQEVMDAIQEWEIHAHRAADIIFKGKDWWFEQYGPFKDNRGFTNLATLDSLTAASVVYFVGEALSHCVKNAVIQAIEYGIDPHKIVILTDCTSAVDGFDMTNFIKEYSDLGVKFMESNEVGA